MKVSKELEIKEIYDTNGKRLQVLQSVSKIFE